MHDNIISRHSMKTSRNVRMVNYVPSIPLLNWPFLFHFDKKALNVFIYALWLLQCYLPIYLSFIIDSKWFWIFIAIPLILHIDILWNSVPFSILNFLNFFFTLGSFLVDVFLHISSPIPRISDGWVSQLQDNSCILT